MLGSNTGARCLAAALILLASGSAPARAENNQLPASAGSAQLAVPRSDMGATVVADAWVVFAGGAAVPAGGTGSASPSAAVDVYADGSGEWQAATLSEPRAGVSALAVGGLALLAGGDGPNGPSDVVDIYDPAADAWDLTSLPQMRGRVLGAAIGDHQAVFVGTRNGYPPSYPDLLAAVYDAGAGTWVATVLASRRYDVGLAVAGTTAVVAGGRRPCGKPCVGLADDTVDVYDAATATWSATRLSEARWGAGTCAVGTTVLVAGGTRTEHEGLGTAPSDRVDLYDTATGTWGLAHLSEPRASPAVAMVGDRCLFVGGRTSSGRSSAVDVYDASTGTWSAAHLGVARAGLVSAVAGGVAYFAGGDPVLDTPSDRVEVYDAATNTWSAAALLLPRAGLAAAGVGDKALFAGGTTTAGFPRLPSDMIDILGGGNAP